MSDRTAEWFLAINGATCVAVFILCWYMQFMPGCLFFGVCCGVFICGLLLRPHQVKARNSAWHWHREAKQAQQIHTELLYILIEKNRQIEWFRRNRHETRALLPERGEGDGSPD